MFTNTAGSATTTAATLTVTSPPVITTQPANATVTVGGTATFTAAASGSPTPTVQWQVSTDGGTTYANVSGATSTTLTVASVTTAQSGNKYRAVFTNSGGTATTNAATLTVTQANLPIVTRVSPSSGGTFSLVFISGKNFGHVRQVSFGSRPTLFLQFGSTFILAIAPPQSSKGTVDVTLTNANGTSAKTSADQFTYTH